MTLVDPRRRVAVVVLFALLGTAYRPAAQPQTQTEQYDSEFARLVKEWTTKPEFLSPLVDHLPVKPGVPTPKDLLGYYIGTPKKLTYTADQQRFFRQLEIALPGRVKTMVAGKSEEGRDILVVFISSEENIKDLEVNRANLKRLADPRDLSVAEAQQIIARTKPHYHVSAGLHSTETSPPEMVMELGYRLAVSEEPFIRDIRNNVIVSISPTTDLDGRDRAVDWYYAYKVDEPYDNSENFGGPPYWGKYAFHDNNRDINYGIDSLRAHLAWYLNWVPPIWHDLHEAQPFLYTFSGQPPQNVNLDPILYSELPFFANYEVSRLTSYGMPGVWHFGFVDTWSPGYLGFAASNHNGMLRMYEIYNVGGATTKKARIGDQGTQREWFRTTPPYKEVDWSIRNSVNYAQTGILTALELTSKFPSMVVENFYNKSAHAIEVGRTKAPHAYVLPAGQRDMTRVARLVNILRMQAIEVGRAVAEVKVKEGAFPAGSFIIKLNQPYGRLAKTLLEKQNYPDPNLRTYDDSAWTMGLMNNTDVKEIADETILDARAETLTADATITGTISGRSGAIVAVMHNGALNLITLRYRLKDVAVKAAKTPFKAGNVEYPVGSFLIPVNGTQADRVRKDVGSLGLVAAMLPGMPAVETIDVDLPRIAVYSTWSSTQHVGWVRLAFDRFEIPYDLIFKDQAKQENLRAKYDVIVMPEHGQAGGKGIVYEQPRASKPLAYRRNDTFRSFGLYGETDDVRGGMGLEGAAEFQRFVENGGVLLTLGTATYFPPEFGLTRSIDAQRPQGNFYAPGAIVAAEIVQPTNPIFFGYDAPNLPVRWADGPLLQLPDPNSPLAAFIGTTQDRATTLLRFPGGDANVLSGLMRGSDQIRNRPALVDAPVGTGHALLYVINPIYRWQNFGEHMLVFNALMFYNDLPAGTGETTAKTSHGR
jgi:Zinc carboxypeptidase